MFGHPASDVIGRNVAVLMPAPHAHQHDDYVRRYLESGVGHIIGIGRELEALHRDGRRIPIYLAVSEVFVDGTRHFTGILRDISRDRAAQEEIRRQHELLSVTVQNAPMGIATYRFGERFATVNRAFEQLTGYDDRSLASRTFADLIDPADRPEFARLTAEAQHGSLTQFSLQLRLVRADGTHITVSTHNAVTHDAHGRPDLVIVQAEDMTAQILATEQERAHRDELTHFARLSTLGEMTAGIAHEINQPLTAISMYAQSGMRMLDAGNPNPARLREALEKLKVQSLRAGAVIDRIQRLVRHREGVREPIDLNELVTDILRLAESDARVNDMQITLDLADALPSVGADPIQLQQVLLNLVRNAIDAMQSIGGRNGRTVEIRTRAIDAGTVRVSVVDSGTGVAREFEPHLFTPFATTKEHGMGMGLSICRSIIEDHGGHLSFVNNPDHGATFYFDLPREFPSED
jgi:two-component system sensor kinase FixL